MSTNYFCADFLVKKIFATNCLENDSSLEGKIIRLKWVYLGLFYSKDTLMTVYNKIKNKVYFFGSVFSSPFVS